MRDTLTSAGSRAIVGATLGLGYDYRYSVTNLKYKFPELDRSACPSATTSNVSFSLNLVTAPEVKRGGRIIAKSTEDAAILETRLGARGYPQVITALVSRLAHGRILRLSSGGTNDREESPQNDQWLPILHWLLGDIVK